MRRSALAITPSMKSSHAAFASFVIVTVLPAANALAALPMGLKCDPKMKIVASEVGEVGKYEVQKGMQKEEHTALINRKKVTPVDTCSFDGLTPGQTLVVRYTGDEVGENEVQCIDLNNNNAQVVFPKSIYTVRSPNLSTYMLNPWCPDGTSKDGFPCSKLTTQSERGSEYKDNIMLWKANDPKTKQYKIDLQFDPAYVSKVPPYTPSVPYGAKLFCALVNKLGQVIIGGTAQYPAATPAPAATSAPSASPSPRSR